MKDRIDSLNHEFISPIEEEDRQDVIMNREDFRIGLGHTTHTEEDQGMDKIIEVGHNMILIIGVVTDIIGEVIRDMGDRIIVTEGETLGTRTTKEIGVGHMRDKIETEEMVEVLVAVDQDQVQEQLQIGIELDILSAESMTIL